MVDATTKRATGAEDVVWDLSVYYDSPDDPRIEEDLAQAEQIASDFALAYRGRVARLTAEELASAYGELEQLSELFGKVEHYASLNFSVYANDPQWGAFIQKITERSAAINQQLVFFDVEWNAVPDARAQTLLADPALSEYAYHLEAERRYKPYQLSEAEEQLLIEKRVTGNNAWTRLFSQITSGMMLDYKGESRTMSEVLSELASSPVREDRKAAADAVTAGLQGRTMELTYIFNVLAADKASDDRRRGYPTWITSRNLSNKASAETVDALIEAVTSSYSLVARHYNIKRALLGYETLYDYDRYAPLNLKENDNFYTWDQAHRIVTEAYHAFDPRMSEVADKFFHENWIHAPVMAGKRGGAFAAYGTKRTHPWVFLNYTGTSQSVMTLAHELGHGIHMYLAGEQQNAFSMATPLTTAEMASVFGEMLVFQDLVAKEDDDVIKLGMLSQKIEDSMATCFRQVAMNRFEDGYHTARRTQGELSTEQLNAIWMETQNAMFEGSVTLRDDYAQWWSYVPHFLSTPGYVYAYAFGELLVLALYNLYQTTGDSFVPQYLDLLASGDSDYPENLLAKIGVDLNDPQFWNEGIDALRKLVDEEEALARSLYPDKFSS